MSPDATNKLIDSKAIEEEVRNRFRTSVKGNTLAGIAWLDALGQLEKAERDGVESAFKFRKVANDTVHHGKEVTYTVEYRVPLPGVPPFTVTVFETSGSTRLVDIILRKGSTRVSKIWIRPDGSWYSMGDGVTTYFNIMAETFAQYCIDSSKADELVSEASWVV